MTKSVTVRVDNPCSEKWAAMTYVDDMHRHCGACDRVLTDFSKMSDDELAVWFVQSKGKVCGRFLTSQLNKPIILPSERNKPVTGIRRGLAALWLLPLSLFSRQTEAQQTVHQSHVSEKTKTEQQRRITIMGTVVAAETGKEIAGARVYIKGIHKASSDSSGRFCFEVPADSSLQISIHAPGDFAPKFYRPDPHKQVITLYAALEAELPATEKQVIIIPEYHTAGIPVQEIVIIDRTPGTRISRFFNSFRFTVSGR